MTLRRYSARPPSGLSISDLQHRPRGVVPRGAASSDIDWAAWLRRIERKRRLLARRTTPAPSRTPAEFLARLTYHSFLLEGMDVTEAEVVEALTPGASRRVRSRQAQRIRNHIAILRWIDRLHHRGEAFKPAVILRWYTSISSGLSTTSLGTAAMNRLEHVARRISSPQLRLQAAIQDVARLHVQLLAEPLVPSFNGILARLLLCCHLGRCQLPAVLWAEDDGPRLSDEHMVLVRLLELVEEGYERLLETPDPHGTEERSAG